MTESSHCNGPELPKRCFQICKIRQWTKSGKLCNTKYGMLSSESSREQFLMNVVRRRIYEIVQTDSKDLEKESEVVVKDIQRNF
jgi:hypothetical protein